jgi:putative NADH-flavin reductase
LNDAGPAVCRPPLEEKIVKVIVFGANGPTGRLVVKQALGRGHLVTAFTRHPKAFPLRDARLRVLEGDALDPDSVQRAVAGQDAVLSTLGVPYTFKRISLYSHSAANIVQAMQRGGVRRLVCVTSSAVEPEAGAHGGFFFEKVLQPLITHTIGRTTYDDQRQMETVVASSGLDWTIVRPSGLFETADISDYRVAERYIRGKFTSRQDLAHSLVKQLDEDGFHQKVLAVATYSVQPNLFKVIAKEALHKREFEVSA